jgi:hypothetical protein
MRFFTIMLCALVLAVAITPAEAGGKKDAKHMCKSELRASYRADGFHDVTVVKKKRGVYKVEGFAERRGRRDSSFVCKVRDGRIAKVKMDEWHKRGGGGGSSQAAGAIIGAVIGAVIVAAISNDHNHDHHQGIETSPDFQDDWGKRYSPHDGITCFRGQRACYKDGKGYNAKWTRREFGG